MQLLIPLTPKLSMDSSTPLDTNGLLRLKERDPGTTLFGYWNSHFWQRCHFLLFLKAFTPFATAARFVPDTALVSDGIEECIDSFGVSGINNCMHNRHGKFCHGGVGLRRDHLRSFGQVGVTKFLLILAVIFTKSHYWCPGQFFFLTISDFILLRHFIF